MNVFVFGNLGSGKGSLIGSLREILPNILIVEEKFSKNPFLSLANQDIKRWGLSLQLKFLADYIESYKETVPPGNKKMVIIDAGVWMNWYVFIENLRNKELISGEEYKLYVQTAKSFVDLVNYPEPDIILYVNTSPEECLERIENRGLNFQKRTNTNYLIELHNQILQMIKNYKKKGVKIVEVDNTKSDVRSLNEVRKVAERIKTII